VIPNLPQGAFPNRSGSLALFLVLALGPGPAGCSGETQGEKLFLWKATSAGAEVYLLGSIHVAPKGFYPLPPEIEEAFRASAALSVEADETQAGPGRIQSLVQEKGMYPAGETLRSKLSPDQRKTLTQILEKVGLPLSAVERMKPWLLSMTLSLHALKKLGYDPEEGIDKHFLKEARERKMEIRELESAEFQLNLLADLPDDLQALFVLSAADEIDGIEERMEKVFQAWRHGDDPALDQWMVAGSLTKHPELAPLMTKLLDERNVGMARKIKGYLGGRERVFVVVGSAHLVGEKGIPALLRKEGFQVVQLRRGVRPTGASP
jgi:uncharacterized protein YbaP (TraB family)